MESGVNDPEPRPTERSPATPPPPPGTAAVRTLTEGLGDEVFERMRPHARRRRFPKGTPLWREGDETGLLVSLVAGQVKIYRVSPSTGVVVTLFRFGPGTTFGFMPFLDGAPYPATAEALTDVEADVIPGDALPGIFASDPEVALFLVRQLARRLRESMERQAQHAFRGAVPRVAEALLGLRPAEPPVGAGDVLTLPVSAREFALDLGVQPETFSRAVTKLVKRGLLRRLEARRFEVLDGDGLRAEAAVPGSEPNPDD